MSYPTESLSLSLRAAIPPAYVAFKDRHLGIPTCGELGDRRMTQTFGHPRSDWDAARSEARDAMIVALRSAKGTIIYGELVRKVSAFRFEPDAHSFHELLGQISRREDNEGAGC